MERKQIKQQKETVPQAVEDPSAKPKMKYFRRVDAYQTPEVQRVKRPNLQKINVDVKNKNFAQILRTQKSSLKCLKEIDLEAFKYENNLNQHLKILLSHIGQNLKQLQEFRARFSICLKEGVRILATHIGKNLNHLQRLDLNFDDCKELNEKDVMHLGRNIKNKFGKLQKLNLHLTWLNNLTAGTVSILASQINKNVNELRHLTLDFSWSKLTDQEVSKLAAHLKNFPQLRELSLDFTNCDELTDLSLSALKALLIGNHLPHLRRLSLKFVECKLITNDGVESFSRCLGRNRTQLEGLTLNFDADQESGVSLLGILFLTAQISQNLRQLKQLKLTFWCGNQSEERCQTFASQVLQNLTHLQNFNLNLDMYDDHAEKIIRSLMTQFGSNRRQLKQLKLQFSCQNFQDKEMEDFINQIGDNFKELETFKLTLHCCLNISDQGISYLGKNLASNLLTLKQLNLTLDDCQSVTNEGIEGLATQIGKRFQQLEKLVLTITAPHVTDEGIYDLVTHISNLKQLRFFTLRTNYCLLTEELLEPLSFEIATNLTHLQSLRICFEFLEKEFSEEATEDFEEEIKTSLKHLRYFYIYSDI